MSSKQIVDFFLTYGQFGNVAFLKELDIVINSCISFLFLIYASKQIFDVHLVYLVFPLFFKLTLQHNDIFKQLH